MINLLSKLSIHPLFWLVIGIGIITGHFKQLLLIFFIVFAHEMGHALTAHFFRWRLKKIELLPFGGVTEVDEHGNRPLLEEMLVIIAGPLMHAPMLLLANGLWHVSLISNQTYEMFIMHNIMILAFNLLPIWPLDGGKLIQMFISTRYPYYRAQRIFMTLSFFLLILFICFYSMYAPVTLHIVIVFTFLAIANMLEWKQLNYAHVRFLLERYYGKQTEIQKLKPLYVNSNDTLFEVMLQFCRGCKHQIILEDSKFDENEILHAYFTDKRTTDTIGDLVKF